MHNRYPDSIRQRCRDLYESGLSSRQVEERTGVTARCVCKWAKEEGYARTRSEAQILSLDHQDDEVGVTWRTLEEKEQEMPFHEAVYETMLAWTCDRDSRRTETSGIERKGFLPRKK